jgi:hypothetical protein
MDIEKLCSKPIKQATCRNCGWKIILRPDRMNWEHVWDGYCYKNHKPATPKHGTIRLIKRKSPTPPEAE